MKGRLFNADGTIAVSAKKHPGLYRSLERGQTWRLRWVRVLELRRKGENERADKLAYSLMGVKGPPMPEERKEHCRQYKQDHKEEIKERAKQTRAVNLRTRQLTMAGKGALRRKR